MLSVQVGAATVTPRPVASEAAEATLKLTRSDFDLVLLREKRLALMIPLGQASVSGQLSALLSFFNALDQPDFWFNTATP
ncbi:MAG: alkyl sulfatase C-terminal domain-containing protein, partial [Pseudomonadota bacterium]